MWRVMIDQRGTLLVFFFFNWNLTKWLKLKVLQTVTNVKERKSAEPMSKLDESVETKIFNPLITFFFFD